MQNFFLILCFKINVMGDEKSIKWLKKILMQFFLTIFFLCLNRLKMQFIFWPLLSGEVCVSLVGTGPWVKRCSMIWIMETQFSDFFFWEMVDFVLKILRKWPKYHHKWWKKNCAKRCAMFLNICKNNFLIFVIFSFWDMVDFVLKIIKKCTKIWS